MRLWWMNLSSVYRGVSTKEKKLLLNVFFIDLNYTIYYNSSAEEKSGKMKKKRVAICLIWKEIRLQLN